MIFLRLAWKSLRNRLLATSLTALSIALSVALLLSVERTRRAAEEGFMSAISRTDLIVGGRTGPLQLILYTVFNLGNATHNISWESYQDWAKNPMVEWTIPYSLGDSYKGYRVVATNGDFFTHYRFRGDRAVEFAEGVKPNGLWDVVLGAEVARRLSHRVGDDIVLSHGATKGESFQDHRDKPFKITGFLRPTGTPIDRSVYITLPGMEALHIDWQDGAAPTAAKRVAADSLKVENLKIHTITAFFLRTKSRIETLRLQREINTYKEEPLLAIIPGATLQELWHSLGYAERVLRLISALVVVVGFAAMLIALTTTLNERRREMAILRSLGAGGGRMVGLLVFESGLLTLAGIAGGTALSLGAFAALGPWLENEFGFYLVGPALTGIDLLVLTGIFLGGLLIGLVPAVRAQRQALKDGLSVRT
ncbi:MAG: ABC transporter permease [Bdellovibrionaceae bacterium]|nr:ABC transporter permease [Pseudobdellovibrionaceae bacterium]